MISDRPANSSDTTLTATRRKNEWRDDLFANLVRRRALVYIVLSTFVVVAYLESAQMQNGEFGFPLDDAWIHQVYARNLGTRGEFSFFAGQPSAGSTSPLWALLLAIGYVAHFDFRIWTILLGILCLAVSATFASRLARRLVYWSTESSGKASQPGRLTSLTTDWLVPLFLIFEWHLVWAAVSGMEILLFVALSLALVEMILAAQPPFWLGIVSGLLTLTRPEGIAFALLVALALVWRAIEMHRRGAEEKEKSNKKLGVSAANIFPALSTFIAGVAVLLAPYIAFNLATSGTILPNTFYAKSQEYAELLSGTNFFVRWLTLYRQPLIGAQILLVPGIFWLMWKLVQSQRFDLLISLVWIALLPALYAARLPVEYQFGRYEMPIIPFIVIYGVVGTVGLLAKIRVRVIRRTWAMTLVVLVVVFAILGTSQYAGSVAIINCEMVATARWTATNLPPDAIIAVHDIGAQGYFDSHPLLDLAGLVSPDVIPFIRVQSRLREWMTARGATYAIFFPSWYPELTRDASLVPIHSENCAATHAAGETDLTVYKISR
jgi:hypothetical protein